MKVTKIDKENLQLKPSGLKWNFVEASGHISTRNQTFFKFDVYYDLDLQMKVMKSRLRQSLMRYPALNKLLLRPPALLPPEYIFYSFDRWYDLDLQIKVTKNR